MTPDELNKEMMIAVSGFGESYWDNPVESYIDGYRAGFKRGAEIMREEARKTALARDTSYYDEDIKAEVLKHSISVDIKDLPIPEIGGT